MEFTNAHFATEEEPDLCCTSAEATQDPRNITAGDTVPSMPKLREVTNSPFQEYAARSGDVTPLPDNVAALICSFKGRAKVQRNGIKVERKELSNDPLFFWHEDSLTCLGKQGDHVLYVLNPNTLDCIHIMDTKGRYLETVVRKNQPDILDTKAAAKEIGKHRAYMTRQQNRLTSLHGEDTDEILKRHRDNTEEMSRSTQIHPAEVEEPVTTTAPRQMPTADRIIARGDAVQTHITDRANQRASAAALGHAIQDEAPTTDHRSQPTAPRDEVTVEDFTSTRNTQPTEPALTAEDW